MLHPGTRFRQLSRTLLGASVGALAALGLALTPAARAYRLVLPLVFIVVLLLIAARFGTAAGALAAIAAALIFAHVLYDPQGSFAVSNDAARANLGWMVLGAIVPAYLLRGSGDRDHGSGNPGPQRR